MLKAKQRLHLKHKLLYQTRLNIWNKNLKFLKKRLKRKKWSFLKFRAKTRNGLDTFRFRPFSFNFSKYKIKGDYRNNLYLRKIIRLKYGKLKNKEFYSLFKNSKNYKDFVYNLGSRLDVFLYNLLSPMSIFLLRQYILHGKVIVNGLVVNSPGFKIKPLDVISFNLIDLSSNTGFHTTKEGRAYFLHIFSRFYYACSFFKKLTSESKGLFVSKISKILEPKLQRKVIGLYMRLFRIHSRNPIMRKGYTIPSKLKKKSDRVSLDPYKFFLFFKKRATWLKILQKVKIKQRRIFLSMFESKNRIKKKKEYLLGFFNDRVNVNNFEIFVHKSFVDIVFLGVDSRIKSNEKFLLHYLYRKK